MAPGNLRPNVSGPTTARPTRREDNNEQDNGDGDLRHALAVQVDGSGDQMARLQLTLHLQRQERKRIGDEQKKQGRHIEYERALETVRLVGEQRGAAS